MTTEREEEQRETCERYGAQWSPIQWEMKVGIARNIREGMLPIHGLRHAPTGDTTGWYLWAGGEPSDDPNFFEPLCAEHLETWCPEAIRFLGLPPGWRFLVAGDYEDVWQDESLLDG